MDKIEFTKLFEQSYAMRESLRVIRTNIQFCGDDMKVILMTSAFPNEGKSTVVINLARSLCETGKRVLVVDTDMRKSVFLNRLGVKLSEGKGTIYGLAHFLSGQKQLNEVIYQTNIENLNMLFAGPSVPNPTEILDKKYFEMMINAARKVYDYILLDTAPIQMAIDAAVIAKHCDGTILIVAQDMVSRRAIAGAVHQMQLTGKPVLGAILNKYATKGISAYGGYYGSYYGAYYGNTEGSSKKSRKKK